MDDEYDIKISETQAIIDLASKIQPIEIGSDVDANVRRVALPPDWDLKELDDEEFLLFPRRKKGNASLKDIKSFIQYINRHSDDPCTTIFCDQDYSQSRVNFTAIFNDHARQPLDGGNSYPGWRDFTAKYTPTFSEEWRRWVGGNKRQFSQLDMAGFIEENLNDIAHAEGMPTGSELLEMATSFESSQDMLFKSAIRLQNGGVNMSFVQDDDIQTLVRMKLFEKIAIGIPVFWGGDAYQIIARLRYKVKDGSLIFWYDLIRSDKVLEHATQEIIKKIEQETSVPMFMGVA